MSRELEWELHTTKLRGKRLRELKQDVRVDRDDDFYFEYPWKHHDPIRQQRLYAIRSKIDDTKFPALRGRFGLDRLFAKYTMDAKTMLNRPSRFRLIP